MFWPRSSSPPVRPSPARRPILIGVTLAGPLFGRGQEQFRVEPSRQPVRGRRVARPGSPRTRRGIDRWHAAKPAAISLEFRRATLAVTVPERRLSAFGEDVTRAIHGGVQFLQVAAAARRLVG